jgi:hypothetical protein
MGFQEREYETQLAKASWWLKIADHWNERDPKFAELLRMRAREIQRAEDAKASPGVRPNSRRLISGAG